MTAVATKCELLPDHGTITGRQIVAFAKCLLGTQTAGSEYFLHLPEHLPAVCEQNDRHETSTIT